MGKQNVQKGNSRRRGKMLKFAVAVSLMMIFMATTDITLGKLFKVKFTAKGSEERMLLGSSPLSSLFTTSFDDEPKFPEITFADAEEELVYNDFRSFYDESIKTSKYVTHDTQDFNLIARFIKLYISEDTLLDYTGEKKIAVGKVILNRMQRPDYPHSAFEVLQDKALNPFSMQEIINVELDDIDVLLGKMVFTFVPIVDKNIKDSIMVQYNPKRENNIPSGMKFVKRFLSYDFFTAPISDNPKSVENKTEVSSDIEAALNKPHIVQCSITEYDYLAKLLAFKYKDCSFEEKLAVATVTINRMKDEGDNRGTLKGIILQQGDGIEPVESSDLDSIHPTDEDYLAAKLSLVGYEVKSEEGIAINDTVLYYDTEISNKTIRTWFNSWVNYGKATLRWHNTLYNHGKVGRFTFYGKEKN